MSSVRRIITFKLRSAMVNVKAEIDNEVPNVAAQLVVQMIRIRDVSGSNIGLRVLYPEFVSRFSSFQTNAGQYTKFGRCHCRVPPFQCIIDCSYYSTLYCLNCRQNRHTKSN
jgi:hypothetical protein